MPVVSAELTLHHNWVTVLPVLVRFNIHQLPRDELPHGSECTASQQGEPHAGQLCDASCGKHTSALCETITKTNDWGPVDSRPFVIAQLE